MCGIGAIVRITPAGEPFVPIPEEWADALDAEIAWRGPDGAGRFRDRVTRDDGSVVEVVLVHRRLAIIDIEGGGQPMVWRGEGGPVRRTGHSSVGAGFEEDPARRAGPPEEPSDGEDLIAVVFNGCIYNHRELRAELEAKGYEFESDHSDTEVLIHLFREHWGPTGMAHSGHPFLEHAMFAAALWDRATQRLYIATDRFGEKPMFTWHADSPLFVVASSAVGVERIMELASDEPLFDRKSLIDWIAFGAARLAGPGELRSTWRGVFPEARAHSMWLSWGPLALKPEEAPRRWLSILGLVVGVVPLILFIAISLATVMFICGLFAIVRAPFTLTSRVSKSWARRLPAHIATLDHALELSVAERLDADVPIGCFLSGGIDSSLIALYASRAIPRLTTVCVRMPDARYDESEHAHRVADILGTNHITIDCSPDPAADLIHIIDTLGLPFGDSSILPTYWLCKAARKHMKVALGGDGGDELFMGYERHRIANLLRWARLPAMFYRPKLDENDPTSREAKKARFLRAARGNGYTDLVAIFDSYHLRRLIRGPRRGWVRNQRPKGRAAARWWDLEHFLPDDLLRKTDTASMLCGLEVRSPFLDARVADFALSLPPHIHLENGETKHLLRELARRHFPSEITERPKQGFAIPIGEWFRTDYGGMRRLLREQLAGDRPFGVAHEVLDFNMAHVRRMLDEHDAAGARDAQTRAHGRDHSQRLFMLLVLALWGSGRRQGPGARHRE